MSIGLVININTSRRLPKKKGGQEKVEGERRTRELRKQGGFEVSDKRWENKGSVAYI